jgi:hypothetical protein
MNPHPAVPPPMIAAIFRGIKTGYHWSFGDPEFTELESGRFDEYQAFFAQLNLKLNRDVRGFYYATSDDDDYKGSDTITKFVVFTAVWIDALADQGTDLGPPLFDNFHAIADLPHFASEGYRRQCQQAGIADAAELQNILRALDRLGFLTINNDGRFQLRAAFHRLLDVCSEYRSPTEPLAPNSEP